VSLDLWPKRALRRADAAKGTPVARYVVDVMPKPEILDPQGKAVLGALPRLGFGGVTDVRQGKRFEVEIEGEESDERLRDVRRMAETLLANPVIEEFTVHPAEDAS
jgi:phosphoribosylformylglycinamidine synthase subunit PurS